MKKKYLFSLAFLIPATLFAATYDTYFFRVVISPTRSKAAAALLFTGKGVQAKDTRQPFYRTTIYTVPRDTGAIILQITPSNDVELTDVKNLFGLADVDLWKQYHTNEVGGIIMGIEPVVDNTAKVPVDVDWIVKASSP